MICEIHQECGTTCEGAEEMEQQLSEALRRLEMANEIIEKTTKASTMFHPNCEFINAYGRFKSAKIGGGEK